MRIPIRREFLHAGVLSSRFASLDPRAPNFAEARVDVDMRQCEFVRPAAVLWCAIYPLLVSERGIATRLLVPENMGVSTYLKSVGCSLSFVMPGWRSMTEASGKGKIAS